MAPTVGLTRRSAWRLAKVLAPELGAKADQGPETRALDGLLALTGPPLKVDWVDLAFRSPYGGRFKFPGAYGVLYAALTRRAALHEAAHNWSKAFGSSASTRPAGARLVLEVLRVKLTGQFLDVRKGHWALHDPDAHHASQVFGLRAQGEGWDGILHRCVRARGTCVAVFRRGAAVTCLETGRVVLVWDGLRCLPST